MGTHSSRRHGLHLVAALALALSLAAALSGCVADASSDTASPPAVRTVESAAPSQSAAATSAPAPEPVPAPAPAREPEPSAVDIALKRAVVTRVVDGDTVHVRLEKSGKTEKVRIIGVDTPENTKEVEPYGAEASEYAREHLDGKTVYLETDAELRDRYGRLLAYVWMSKPRVADEHGNPTFGEVRRRMFDAMLVRHGYASVMTIPPNVKYAEHFVRLQREARDANRGLWGLPAGGSSNSSSGGSLASSGGSFIGNRNSMKLHIPSCSGVAQMNPANKVPLSGRDAGISAGYVPCKLCRP